jgi:hypothetical protein
LVCAVPSALNRCDAASNPTFFGLSWEMSPERVAFRAVGRYHHVNYVCDSEMRHVMTIEKFLVSGVAALTLASVAIVPSTAFAQVSPGAGSDTGAIVGGIFAGGAVAAVAFVGVSGGPAQTVAVTSPTETSRSKKLVRKAGKSPKFAKARKYNWNLALAH